MWSVILKWKLLPSEYFALLIIHIDKPLVSDKVVELDHGTIGKTFTLISRLSKGLFF